MLLKSEERDKETDAEALGPKEINKRLARTEEEYAIFKEMDKARVDQGRPIMDLVTEDELPVWLTNPETVTPKDEENPEGFGRGKRRKAEVMYTDNLDEDEFCMLMERGADEAEIKAYIAERDARQEAEAAELEGVAAATLQSLDMVELAAAAASMGASEAPAAAATVAPPTVTPPVAAVEPDGEALEPETKRLKFRLKMPTADEAGENGKQQEQ